eukprot:TRINITY_DN10675_c0_g1_i1.p1 TRINITY_DN10675_c0_g1~~TRINITY_DN10675_c0_g1_i1.p1  ORF type:complete len:497 (-),score=119.98 TRINITY_DN10675_c0_g1_i1:194-1684(-)
MHRLRSCGSLAATGSACQFSLTPCARLPFYTSGSFGLQASAKRHSSAGASFSAAGSYVSNRFLSRPLQKQSFGCRQFAKPCCFNSALRFSSSTPPPPAENTGDKDDKNGLPKPDPSVSAVLCYSTPLAAEQPAAEAAAPPAQKTPMQRVIELLGIYASLGKIRLSSLVILTTMHGYYMAPVVFDPRTFLWSSFGTTLAAISANSLNQYIEIEHDSKMSRTVKRTLPSGRISPTHALLFGLSTGTLGCGMLFTMVNPVSASLAFSTIILYTLVYTPFKRVHPINTWIGSVVGAIPPMIGWVAGTGRLDAGAWALATLLFVWQIPHFLALSWGLRNDYSKAGYQMLSSVKPSKLPSVTLRWTIYLAAMGFVCAAAGLTDWWFALDSAVVGTHMLYSAFRFYRDNTNANARRLFFSSLWYLPLFMLLMMFHKINAPSEESAVAPAALEQPVTILSRSPMLIDAVVKPAPAVVEKPKPKLPKVESRKDEYLRQFRSLKDS